MADFDPATPSIARVYDYLLNGRDNFAVDREVAQKLLAVVPDLGRRHAREPGRRRAAVRD